MPENQNNIKPNYYNGTECLDAIRGCTKHKSSTEAFITGNIIKYLWRYESKNGLEDIRKAKEYIELLIKEVENSKV